MPHAWWIKYTRNMTNYEQLVHDVLYYKKTLCSMVKIKRKLLMAHWISSVATSYACFCCTSSSSSWSFDECEVTPLHLLDFHLQCLIQQVACCSVRCPENHHGDLLCWPPWSPFCDLGATHILRNLLPGSLPAYHAFHHTFCGGCLSHLGHICPQTEDQSCHPCGGWSACCLAGYHLQHHQHCPGSQPYGGCH